MPLADCEQFIIGILSASMSNGLLPLARVDMLLLIIRVATRRHMDQVIRGSFSKVTTLIRKLTRASPCIHLERPSLSMDF